MAYVTNASSSTIALTPKGKATVKAESKPAVPANRDRIGLYLTNTGAQDVFLALGTTAAAGEGVCLKKEGAGNQPLRIPDYTGAVAAITKEGESILTYSEV